MIKEKRFYRTNDGYDNYYFKLQHKEGYIFIPCDYPGYRGLNFKRYIDIGNYYSECKEISDFINSICFELLKTFGFEYDIENQTLDKVIYTWDINLIPGEKFFGVEIHHLIGCEETWAGTFSGIDMGLDILDRYDFTLGYIGLKKTYPLYLPYTEENIELYKKFIEFKINESLPSSRNPKKIKI